MGDVTGINESSSMIMLTGVARSGTTLLAECLDHHPEIMCISDAMNEFFKGFMRYAYRTVENERKTTNYPIDHFFFSGSRRVSQFIDHTDLKHRIPDDLKEEILARIILRDGEYCPEIVESVRQCKAQSFDTLFIEMLGILHDTYGKAGTVHFGTKAGWCEQLIRPLAKTFPNMVFINIIRDPRAIVASNYAFEKVTTARYPLPFHVRDWRKTVYYTWKFRQEDEALSSRVTSVKYEDLVENPREILDGIARFLSVRYDDAMLHRSFKKPNTSHKDTVDTRKISTQFTQKWKAILPESVVSQIEACCGREMGAVGYGRMHPEASTDADRLVSSEGIAYDSLSEWCKELVGSKAHYQTTWCPMNNLLEAARLTMLRGPKESMDSRLTAEFFYEDRYYQFLNSSQHLFARSPEAGRTVIG